MIYQSTMQDSAWIDYDATDFEPAEARVDDFAKIQPKELGSSIGMIQVDLETDDEDGNSNNASPAHNPGRDIMSRFFDIWDDDASGYLDVEEVLQGVEKFCDSMHLDYDSRRVSKLFDELDTDGNQELDRKEFTVFLRKYADMNDIGMEDLAYVMATDDMGDEPVVKTRRRRTSNPTIFFTNLFSAMAMKQNDDAKINAASAVRAEPSTAKPAAAPKQSLATFFNRFARRGNSNVGEEETVTDTTVEETKPSEPDDEIKNMLWE